MQELSLHFTHYLISSEMALRQVEAFDTSPESWLNQQMQYDLWMAKQNLGELHVEKLVHPA